MISVRIPVLLQDRIENLVALVWQRDNAHTLILVLAALLSGLIAVTYAKIFSLAESAFITFAAAYPYGVFVIIPSVFLIAWAVIKRFSPEAGGSGIPQVLAANETTYEGPDKSFVDRLLSLRVIVVKILTSALCILGGGAIGREGPTLQVSASLFHLFGKRARTYFPESKSHLWIVTGAASGLAAAFNTPLGGIVYAIEELGAKHFDQNRNALLVAIIISGLVSQAIIGDYLYLGTPTISVTGMISFPLALAVGLLSGGLGAIWAQLLIYLVQLRGKISGGVKTGVFIGCCGLLMAMLVFFNIRSAGSGVLLIDDLLFHNELADLQIVLSRFFGTILTYLSGTAGGIFSPSLAIGAAIGNYFATLVGLSGTHLMTLLGMIGFLTGVTRVPFTSFILVLEMTNGHSAIFPMMITALSAAVAGKVISKDSFYEEIRKNFYNPLSKVLEK